MIDPVLRAQGLKTCNRCKQTKTLASFHKDKKRSDSLCVNCKACYHDDYVARRRKIQIQHRAKRYQISPAEHGAMLEDHEFVCAICGRKEQGRALSIDHDHTTGQVRGLLCGNCNSVLGFVRDTPWILRAAATYLVKYGVDPERVT